ncbi:YqiA/YcfP family alpha/beta fold hydrolase [Phocaeicola coprocola]|uniref:YqiA/YcfP family alpha/beta fold hydrolase n=1 Tax=Phocaeicola coprocola TaxID=310298 RepID=UPI00241F4522|nr:YqiA/YcfP family alpha/beta fold hydrolase [Phocaeicola coprocola]
MKNKILYIHGLSSSGSSSTARNLQALLPDYSVLSPDLPVAPQEALDMLRHLCELEQPQLIIGTSMGGMFAQQLRGYKKILVNPAFHVSEFMRTQIGVHEFLNPRRNGETHYEITSSLCDAYQKVEKGQFSDITELDKENTYALFGTKDTLVHGYDEFMLYYKKASWFEGEHRLNLEVMRSSVIPLVEEIMAKGFKEALRTSPLFNLSLCSKELFHSNFLYWLGTTHCALFVAVCKELGCKVNWNASPENIKREYCNLDLCACCDRQITFILENKVKSIPQKSQLDRYVRENNPQTDNLILLSLATEFPDKESILNDGLWKIRSYKDLCEAISKHKKLLEGDSYALALVEDYCSFINNLHQLSQTWLLKKESYFLLPKDEKKEIEELRIGDLMDKIWYSQLCASLNKYIMDKFHLETISGYGIEAIAKTEGNILNTVYTNWGFTHGQGLLEAKLRINNDYVLFIQIQGNRYEHGIEWICERNCSHSEFWNRTQSLDLISELSFLQFSETETALFPSVCVNEPITARKKKGEVEKRIYNKYNDRFLYQSKKIKENAFAIDVLYAISEEIGYIVEKANNAK